MKWTQLLGITLRQTNDTELISHELLLRAGYIRQLSTGIYSLLHFGHRSQQKIATILREEINRIGGVEISMPVVQPAEIWEKTGRYTTVDESLLRFTDRSGKRMVLGMTHEEVVASLVRHEVSSYKQLPKLVYQIQTKYRDELRPRAGLIRVKEFAMKDSYSLDRDWEGLERQYQAHFQAYLRIFERVGLPVLTVESDVGMMGGRKAHEFMYQTEGGEDSLFVCHQCGYRANKEVARFRLEKAELAALPPSMEKVATPGTKTIAALAAFLGISPAETGKVVFFSLVDEEDRMEELVIGMVRGDLEVNEIKLQNHVKTPRMRAATEAEIRSVGAAPGYGSPVGLSGGPLRVVVDPSVAAAPGLVVGANEVDAHYRNARYGRDFEAHEVVDIAMAYEQAACPACDSGQLQVVRGVEVGNIFQLGTKYTEGLGAQFAEENDELKPVVMGSYGIGLGRLLACLVEEHHDADGLNLPISVAPYQVLLTQLGTQEEVQQAAQRVYQQCWGAGIELLWDDRPIKSAGVKFKDADLVGIPLRLTISKKSLEKGGVEWKLRGSRERHMMAFDEIIPTLRANIEKLQQAPGTS